MLAASSTSSPDGEDRAEAGRGVRMTKTRVKELKEEGKLVSMPGGGSSKFISGPSTLTTPAWLGDIDKADHNNTRMQRDSFS